MNKELKKCYEYLDLPINSTIEDVQAREKALIKIYQSKAQEKGVSYEKQIGLVETYAREIIENIKNNGVVKEEFHRFESSWNSISILLIIFVFTAMLCFFSFYIFK